MPIIWGEFDVDIPFTNPNPVTGPTGLPCELGSTGLSIWGNAIGGWNVGFRGTIYIKFKNNAGTTKTLYVYIGDGTETVEISAGSEVVAEIPAVGLVSDLTVIDISGNSVDVQITGLQLTPFTPPVFWTSLKGVTEIS